MAVDGIGILFDVEELSQAAGDKFRAAGVGLVILQLLTCNMLPAVRDLDVPIVLVNLQKRKAPDCANTGTAAWLGELYACGAVPAEKRSGSLSYNGAASASYDYDPAMRSPLRWSTCPVI